jgi:hypothetical protein
MGGGVKPKLPVPFLGGVPLRFSMKVSQLGLLSLAEARKGGR